MKVEVVVVVEISYRWGKGKSEGGLWMTWRWVEAQRQVWGRWVSLTWVEGDAGKMTGRKHAVTPRGRKMSVWCNR